MDKPDTCQGCPLQESGKGFTLDELTPNATTLVLRQAPGNTDDMQAAHFFPLASLVRGENVAIANVIKCRVDKLPTGQPLQDAITHCTSKHLTIPTTTTLVIADDEIAASWCANRPIQVYRFRGHILYPIRKELEGVNDRTPSANEGSRYTVSIKEPQLCERIQGETQSSYNSVQKGKALEGYGQQGTAGISKRIPENTQESEALRDVLGTSTQDARRTTKQVCNLPQGREVSNRSQPYNSEGTGVTLQPLQQSNRLDGRVNSIIRSSNQIYTGRGLRVFVVESIDKVMKEPKGWWLAEIDWRCTQRTAHSWPRMIPSRLIATTNNWNEVLKWLTSTIQSAPYVAIDTEFVGRPFGSAQPLLTMVGLGWVDAKGNVHGLQMDCRAAEPWMKASFYSHLAQLVAKVPVLFQNYAADMPILKRCAGIQYESYKQVDDQMLAHAVLYCELPHDLEFLTSIYGEFYKIKHLGDYSGMTETDKWASLRWLEGKGWLVPTAGDTPDLLYNWGDVIEPLMIWSHLKKAFDMDQQAYQVYRTQSIGLVPILLRSMERGIKVNRARVIQARDEYEGRVRQAQVLAESYYGKPINLGSDDQIGYYCYRERDYPIQISKKTRNPTVDEDAIAVLRAACGGPEVDTKIPLTLELALSRIDQGADPILEARVLYQEAQHALDAYIYGLVSSVYNEHNESKKKAARKLAKARGFTIDDIVDRVYPNFAIHTQKNARWSTTNPPLAQLPGDLRDIIQPDEGECWLHHDWSGMELHFLECHAHSRILKDAHDNGLDLHTWTMCKMFSFQLPPNCKVNEAFKAPENQAWRDKYSLHYSGDPRRVFAKSARFEMNYGGTGATAASKAIRMGLSKIEVNRALQNLLTADIDYFKWKEQIERQVKATRVIRTFTGRPRRFLSIGRDTTAVPAKVVREALDYPMQAGVSDVANLTIIEMSQQYPQLSLAWTMHDAQDYHCKLSDLTPELIAGYRAILNRPYTIEGRVKQFPVDCSITYPPSYTGVRL